MDTETMADFKTSLSAASPPASFSVYGQAIWWAGKGNWEKAHTLVQDLEDRSGARIHAYLHRLEGDISNAGYWYSRANTKMPEADSTREWENLVEEFLSGKI
jgi:hypothetical protein